MRTYDNLLNPPLRADLKSPRQPVWAMVLAGIVGGCVSYFAISTLLTASILEEIKALSGWQEVLAIGSFPLAAWLAILVHEFGHLLGVKLGGMRPGFLLAGPLRVTFDGKFPRVSFNKVLSTWGGLALSLPRNGNALLGILSLMIAGGPFSSLLSALLGWIAAANSMDVGRISIGLFAMISTMIAIATMISIRAGGYYSDGAQLLQILRSPPLAKAKYLISIVIAERLSGIRPREWSVDAIHDSLGLIQDSNLRTSGLSLIAMAADDSGDSEQAGDAYDRLAQHLKEGGLEAYPTEFLRDLIIPIASFVAQRMKDAQLSQRWMDLSDGSAMEMYLDLYAKAAIASANLDRKESQRFSNQALSLMSSNGLDGAEVFYKERLTSLALSQE
jgi:hypothetical protein